MNTKRIIAEEVIANGQSVNKNNLSTFLLLIVLLMSTCIQAQTAKDGANFDQGYFKNKTVFHKLTWIDKNGSISREATLKLTAQIDSVQKKFIYTQVRNDGKKDSTICELGSLNPIYTVSKVRDQSFVYDYSTAGFATYKVVKNGKVASEDKIKTTSRYYDGFISEYMLGALPLKVGYSFKFETFRADLKRNSETSIDNTFLEVLNNGNSATLVYVLSIKSEGLSYMVWVDKKSKEVLKAVFPLPDGGAFVKERI